MLHLPPEHLLHRFLDRGGSLSRQICVWCSKVEDGLKSYHVQDTFSQLSKIDLHYLTYIVGKDFDLKLFLVSHNPRVTVQWVLYETTFLIQSEDLDAQIALVSAVRNPLPCV